MRWITPRNIHVDRTSSPWLIRTFIDPQGEFDFVEPNSDPATLDGHTFDMRGAECSHEGDECTFQVIVQRHNLSGDAELAEMGRIIRDADVPPPPHPTPRSAPALQPARGDARRVTTRTTGKLTGYGRTAGVLKRSPPVA